MALHLSPNDSGLHNSDIEPVLNAPAYKQNSLVLDNKKRLAHSGVSSKDQFEKSKKSETKEEEWVFSSDNDGYDEDQENQSDDDDLKVQDCETSDVGVDMPFQLTQTRVQEDKQQPKTDNAQEPKSPTKRGNKLSQVQVVRELKPLPLVRAGHCMKADQRFGWKPEVGANESMPIPLCFGLVSYNKDEVMDKSLIVYVGPRHQNSYDVHKKYANQITKFDLTSKNGCSPETREYQSYKFDIPKLQRFNNFRYEDAFERFAVAMKQQETEVSEIRQVARQNMKETPGATLDPPLQCIQEKVPRDSKQVTPMTSPTKNTSAQIIQTRQSGQILEFDSNFEGGNLDLAALTNPNSADEYDLVLRLDSNSRSHQQWFYFSVKLRRTGMMKDRKVKFNILNFTKPFSLYQQGMQPVVWSERSNKENGTGWERGGTNITYKASKLWRMYYLRPCMCLSFEYTFKYGEDKVWFAYSVPYTYSMLTNFLSAVQDLQNKEENKDNKVFKQESIGQTLSGVSVPLITITDFSENNKKKKTILMSGRMHPGETHASWVMHGFIRFLISPHSDAKKLRKRLVFKIVPMLNIDGVILGNYRASFAGLDINRMFGESASERLNPEAQLLKKLAKNSSRLTFFFDVHSHSSKKSIFMYGLHFPLHSEHYLKVRVLPKILQERSEMFRYYSCRFRNEKSKQNCARLALSREVSLPNCYTIEVSMMGYINKNRHTRELSIINMQQFGGHLGAGLLDWIQIVDKHKQEKIKRAILLSQRKKAKRRTVADYLGMEDAEEYKEEIDLQLKQLDQQQQRTQNDKKKRAKSKKAKLRKRSQHKKEQTSEASDAQQLVNVLTSNNQAVSDPPVVSFYEKDKIIKDEQEVDRKNSSDSDQSNHNIIAQPLAPKLDQVTLDKAKKKTEEKEKQIELEKEKQKEKQHNKGFLIPRFAGFEYYETEGHKQRGRDQVADLVGKRTTKNVDSNAQDGSEELRNEDRSIFNLRLEDIYSEIKKDMVKVTEQKGRESELDSEQGFTSDEEEPQVQDEDEDNEEYKIQQCLLSFFDHMQKPQNDSEGESPLQYDNNISNRKKSSSPTRKIRPHTSIGREDKTDKAKDIKQAQGDKSTVQNNSSSGNPQRKLTQASHTNSNALQQPAFKTSRHPIALKQQQQMKGETVPKKEIIFQVRKPTQVRFPGAVVYQQASGKVVNSPHQTFIANNLVSDKKAMRKQLNASNSRHYVPGQPRTSKKQDTSSKLKKNSSGLKSKDMLFKTNDSLNGFAFEFSGQPSEQQALDSFNSQPKDKIISQSNLRNVAQKMAQARPSFTKNSKDFIDLLKKEFMHDGHVGKLSSPYNQSQVMRDKRFTFVNEVYQMNKADKPLDNAGIDQRVSLSNQVLQEAIETATNLKSLQHSQIKEDKKTVQQQGKDRYQQGKKKLASNKYNMYKRLIETSVNTKNTNQAFVSETSPLFTAVPSVNTRQFVKSGLAGNALTKPNRLGQKIIQKRMSQNQFDNHIEYRREEPEIIEDEGPEESKVLSTQDNFTILNSFDSTNKECLEPNGEFKVQVGSKELHTFFCTDTELKGNWEPYRHRTANISGRTRPCSCNQRSQRPRSKVETRQDTDPGEVAQGDSGSAFKDQPVAKSTDKPQGRSQAASTINSNQHSSRKPSDTSGVVFYPQGEWVSESPTKDRSHHRGPGFSIQICRNYAHQSSVYQQEHHPPVQQSREQEHTGRKVKVYSAVKQTKQEAQRRQVSKQQSIKVTQLGGHGDRPSGAARRGAHRPHSSVPHHWPQPSRYQKEKGNRKGVRNEYRNCFTIGGGHQKTQTYSQLVADADQHRFRPRENYSSEVALFDSAQSIEVKGVHQRKEKIRFKAETSHHGQRSTSGLPAQSVAQQQAHNKERLKRVQDWKGMRPRTAVVGDNR